MIKFKIKLKHKLGKIEFDIDDENAKVIEDFYSKLETSDEDDPIVFGQLCFLKREYLYSLEIEK